MTLSDGRQWRLNRCCQAEANHLFAGFSRHEECFENSHLLAEIKRVGARYPRFWNKCSFVADVRVADLRSPASALRLSTPCATCDLTVSVIVISSQLMLMIWRLTLLFGEIVETWDFATGRVEHREPTPLEVAEFKAIIESYLYGHPTETLDVPQFERRWSALIPEAAPIFRLSASLGQLWFVAHEFGHAWDESFLKYTEPFQFNNRAQLERTLSPMNLGPRTERLWLDELAADIIATDLLFDSLAEQIDERCLDDASVLTRVAADIGGGIAAACEALYQIEIATIGERSDWRDVVSSHPYPQMRWDINLNYLQHLSRTGSIEQCKSFGLIYGRSSQLFTRAAGLGPVTG